MGEVDTKPIESVQAALSLFGEKSEQRKKKRSSSGSDDSDERENDLQGLLKGLANHKVQLEAKDSAYKQALLKLDQHQKTSDELAVMLKNYEFEKDIYMSECKQGRMKIHNLESNMKQISDQLSESVKMREQLSVFGAELKATRAELLRMESELAAARDEKLGALSKAEIVETELRTEKGRTGELLKQVLDLEEAIVHLKLAAAEEEKEMSARLSEKEVELGLAMRKAAEAMEQVESMRNELEALQDLDNQLAAKSGTMEEQHRDGIYTELNRLKLELAAQERKNSDQIGRTTEEANDLQNSETERLMSEMEKMAIQMEEMRARETEAQVEIAMLKSELHKGRSKVAAAEAAEARALSEKLARNLAVQQLALEAEEAKREVGRLRAKAAAGRAAQQELAESAEYVKIGKEEYEALIKKAASEAQGGGVVVPVPQNKNLVYGMETNLRKELEMAMVKIGELRSRAEQAASRAEAAEKAKAALEEQKRSRQERRERRKAAWAALKEETGDYPLMEEESSINGGRIGHHHQDSPKTDQPLFQVLNMKF
ncbi:WEB family protein At1g12150-like [Diospyros lotus]|uniref:WEB family protein At1g12150-like n=1 Tax=Diospyros lotus TaxID=55363 RepID=UPI00225B26EB|nr:WEB family protein At1g12150-like [Diospyros lotus]XP_052176927.1 WEB family protein At1g12150-like [Diospyros lotus]XP_052176928.1 WEB family protein At1g12150-like [Diospyros lotus]XP_052176929.1 WEB family protein At1g12150-like [Diospyros lotus]XP_052176930.1 WEB family protein At1g12150-like [Diospyros lotus]XP_052176931.1 WEB family protein At1g12150-like [Diospyros lotus]XP_052176932.1 WEB family protein At1g12150-like [Diospyros lotus]